MQELSQFMSLVSTESQKVQKIKEEKEKKLTPKIDVNKSLGDFFAMISEVKSVSSIVEAPKVSGDHDLFKSNTHLQISLPEPKEDLESELVKVKNTVSGRTEKDIQSVKNHDTHSWYAIEQYCKENNLEYNEGLCESIVVQSKPTIKYFKDMFAVKRPFEIDGTLDVLPSTTNNTRSYPSGHATQAMLVALHLSEKHPDHKDALIRAAKECGLGRIVAGFHYPMDYKTGNLLAEKMFVLMNRDMEEAARIPRKKGQPAGSDKHSDLYTDENPKGTIHGLGFKDPETARASIKKIENSDKTHAHKVQAAVAMEQRAKEMGKSEEAAIYRAYIEKMKKKTKEMQKEEFVQPQIIEKHYIREIPVEKKVEISEQDNAQRIDALQSFFNKLDHFEETLNQKELASKMKRYMPEAKDSNELTELKEQFNHFRKLVTHQMSTIGGGGAVNLLDLDDIDTSSLGNGKFLVYNSTSGKLEFTDQVDGN